MTVATQQQLDDIKKTVNSAEKEEASIEANRSTIDQFTQKITDRETQLEKQEKSTQDYLANLKQMQEAHEDSNAKLVEYVTQKKTKLSDLIDEARVALELNTARGLSKVFQTKAASLKPGLGFRFFAKVIGVDKKEKIRFFSKHGNASGWWLIGSATFIALAIILALLLVVGKVDCLGIEFKDGPWYQMVSRLSIVGLLVTASVFCAKQFTRARGLYEDYAYRQILTASLPGFLEKLEEYKEEGETLGAQYLQSVLNEIKTHPIRENIHSNNKEMVMNINKDQLKQLKNIITPSSSD